MAEPNKARPLVSENFLDAPTQRLLAVGLAVFFQARKIWEVLQSYVVTSASQRSWLLLKWGALDALFFLALPLFRIPRLKFSLRVALAQLLMMLCINWAALGDWHIPAGTLRQPLAYIPWLNTDTQISITERKVTLDQVVDASAHLLGQHTVRLSPINTAKLNPQGLSYCLAPHTHNSAFVPIVFNNSQPHVLQYSISPLGDKGPRTYVNLTWNDLKSISSTRTKLMSHTQTPVPVRPRIKLSEADEWDQLDEEEEKPIKHNSDEPALSKTERLAHVRIVQPGVVRLERVLDKAGADFRIRYSEVVVVECPSVGFEPAGDKNLGNRCTGDRVDMSVRARGVAPIELKWGVTIAPKTKYSTRRSGQDFTIRGIEGKEEIEGAPVAQDLIIPLSFSFDSPGRHTFALANLSDAIGNSVNPALPQHSLKPGHQTSDADLTHTRTFDVLSRPSAAFENCQPGKDLQLLKGKEGHLNIIVKAESYDEQDGWGAHISFVPDEPVKADATGVAGMVGKVAERVANALDKTTTPTPWTKFFPAASGSNKIKLPATESGTYTLTRVAGDSCEGVVRSPEVCRVVEVPLPRAEVEVERIHECSGDVGIHTIFTMDGTPPFRIHYTTTDSKGTTKSQERYLGARGELKLQPNKSGTYTYSFDAVSDAYYSEVPLTGPGRTVTQVVHPLASAKFTDANVDTCGESQEIEVALELSGVGPWKVEMQLGSEVMKFDRLKRERETVKVPIPKEVYARGGKVGLDLVSVEDGNGCKRTLSSTQMSVEVRRVKPTARFYSQDGSHRIVVPHESKAELPLRLTGDKPWRIEYRTPGSQQVHKKLLHTANDQLSVKAAGKYEIVSVSDHHCPGTVVPEGAFYHVDWIPLPAVGFAHSAGAFDKEREVIVRPPVCAGEEDYAEVALIGRSPFQVTYSHTDPKSHTEESLFTSLKNITRLAMRTSESGTHTYALQHLVDTTYNNGIRLDTRRTRGLRLEQNVLMRPSARFKSTDRISRCLNTDLNLSHDPGAVLSLTGTPPFTLSVAVRNLAEGETHHTQIVTNDHEWAINVPDYMFRTIGPHQVAIERIRDASQCAELGSASERLLWIDVAETAAIIPLERRVDYCVGDVLNFQLEGTAPWQVGYTFNGKHTSAKSASSRFSRVAAQPGIFRVESIAHQQNYCKTAVRDVEMKIHQLPTARVSDGNRVIEDIREGDQAEIVFKLTGEPPFTFTYQRTELIDPKKKSKTPPKVAETHTVSNVFKNEHSIFSAAEGTWTVTFISDKWCRYPTAAVDSTVPEA
ncbi:putative nucleoporin [Rhizoctonia solani 123E]|uniref:Putative nucleoporin n=1 Tax=Rhizoctonia solani 123E TaxID=1423351 RepID=A0A074S9K1_9AGAM|nr:putative nucleoporin [Rhizoctonia solani 123E]